MSKSQCLTPEFFTEPVQDWFHKHVVSSVVETDTTGGGVATETYYDYSTAGGGTPVLWAFDDSEFTEDEHRTYGQWRGYAQATTRLGDPAQPQTQTRARFYRGLDGQPLPGGGSRQVVVTDAEGNTAADHEALAGRVWESLSFDGTTVISGSTSRFWTRKTATQARDHDGGDLHAWLTGRSVEQARTRLVGSTWQRAEARTSFDTQGRPIRVDDLGEVAGTGDERCTRTEYADNSSAWIKDAVSRVETVSVDCGATPSRPGDVVSDTRMFFDGSNTHGATPSKGQLTRTDVLDTWQAGPVYETTARMSYDPLGRLVSSSDALGRTTSTAYTPTGAGPVTQTATTNPAGHVMTTELNPAWGTPVAETEPNGRRTELSYDALGRSTTVWLPGSTVEFPSMRFEYLVRDGAPSAVITRTLNHLKQYLVNVDLFDALLRQRQTQVETADRGRLVTETVYDTQGRVDEQFGPNHNLDPPDTTIVRVREEDSAARTGFFYDGAGRVVDEVFYNKHVERWRTTTSYGGSPDGFLVTVQPPLGASATGTVTNARGQTIEKRTYRGNTPAGTYDTLSYAYTPGGQIDSMTDPAGNDWSWDYDLRGRQAAAHDPDAGTSTMSYDAADQLVSTTDARGQTVVNAFDELGRQLTRHDGGGTLLAEWEYDTARNGIGMLGKATRWVDGNAYVQQIHTVNHQGLAVLRSTVLPPSEGSLAGRYFFTTNYTVNGQVVLEGFDAAGDVEGGILMWNYDYVGNPTSLIFDGDLTGATVIVDDATYTPFNEIQTRRLGASSGRHAFQGFVYEEGTRRLERATFDREASINAVADLRHTYDPAGNLRSIADLPEDLPGNHELQCFQYDPQRRLTEAWAQGDTSGCAATPGTGVLGGPAPYWNSYQHDAVGNRTAETLRVPGAPAQTRGYTYPPAGQPQPHALQQVTGTGPQQTYDYDPSGNTTSRQIDGQAQTLNWNPEGNLETVEEPGEDTVRMVYDPEGNRLIRDDGDTVTAYMPQTELTWHRDTGQLDGTRYFTHAGQVVATCTGQDVADWVWMGVDHHGTTTTHSINAFTAVEQVRRTDPYGNPRGPQPANWPGQQTFVGGVGDPTGLVHIGARSYDPTTGRFITVDPILALGDDQQINGYAYANNNPITFTDPTGQMLLETTNGNTGQRAKTWKKPNGSTHTAISGKPASSTSSGGGGGNGGGGSGEPDRDVPKVIEDNDLYTIEQDAAGNIFLNGFLVPAGGPTADQLAADLAQYCGAVEFYCEDLLTCTFWDDRCLDEQAWEIQELLRGVLSINYGESYYRILFGSLKEQLIEAFASYGPGGGGFRGAGGIRGPGGSRGRCSSFQPGTLVLMADGTHKPIEDAQPGDVVLASDPETGITGPQPVKEAVSSTGGKTLAEITIVADGYPPTTGGPTLPAGGRRGATIGRVIATHNHPFWDATQDIWTDAGSLQPRDQLRTSHSVAPTVAAVTIYVEVLTVHNLTIANTHTYYVLGGNTPVLVHNTAAGCPPPNLSPPGSGRQGAFNQAKRDSGIPASMVPSRVFPNVDRRGNPQPGRIYEFDVPSPGGGIRTVRIREDASGHVYPDNPTQNRGPHFNTESGGHYDY